MDHRRWGGRAGRYPAWFHNLIANPAVTIEVGSETFPATATVTAGEERAASSSGSLASSRSWPTTQRTRAGRSR
jgi:deazaflavin-dependent oxidoreductase (nitroreductase family)